MRYHVISIRSNNINIRVRKYYVHSFFYSKKKRCFVFISKELSHKIDNQLKILTPIGTVVSVVDSSKY